MNELTVLCITDLHSDPAVLERLDRYLDERVVDLVLLAGDITEHKGNNESANVSYLRRLLQIVREKHKVELLGVHGNNDSEQIFNLLEATGVSLHLRRDTFKGYTFSGIGGWGTLDEMVLDIEQAANFSTADSIFVSHIPPRSGTPGAGPRPILHICGHLHSIERVRDNAGVPVVQLKTAMLGRGALVKLPQRSVEFISL